MRSLAEGMAAFDTYAADLDAAGVLISAEVLADSSATTTVSKVDGEFRIQDGRFADTKEQLAGTSSSTSKTSTRHSNGRSEPQRRVGPRRGATRHDPLGGWRVDAHVRRWRPWRAGRTSRAASAPRRAAVGCPR